jgi:hypothetical protein
MAERSIVIIEADHLARTEFTPDDFDFLLDCAEVGLEGAPEVFSSDRERADRVWALVQRLRKGRG